MYIYIYIYDYIYIYSKTYIYIYIYICFAIQDQESVPDVSKSDSFGTTKSLHYICFEMVKHFSKHELLIWMLDFPNISPVWVCLQCFAIAKLYTFPTIHQTYIYIYIYTYIYIYI